MRAHDFWGHAKEFLEAEEWHKRLGLCCVVVSIDRDLLAQKPEEGFHAPKK